MPGYYLTPLHTDHGGHGHADDSIALATREAIDVTSLRYDIVSVSCFYSLPEIHECSSQHASHNHTLDPPIQAPQHNLNLLGVLIHLCGDAVNSMFLDF
jgi:zinc transporter 1